MKKLIMLLRVILIGLNLSSCDPEESFYFYSYQRVLQNDTDMDIKLVYPSLESNSTNAGDNIVTDTIILTSNNKIYFGRGGSKEAVLEENFKLIIEQNINTFNVTPKFELYIGNKFIKEWKGTASYLGNEINSPYNYNSWKIIKYNEVLNPNYGEFIYGEIVFTITDEDIE